MKKIGWNRKVDKQGNVIGYGRYVVIVHKDGYQSLYAHLEKDGVKFKVGDKVNDGDIIAVSGNTGCSTVTTYLLKQLFNKKLNIDLKKLIIMNV